MSICLKYFMDVFQLLTQKNSTLNAAKHCVRALNEVVFESIFDGKHTSKY